MMKYGKVYYKTVKYVLCLTDAQTPAMHVTGKYRYKDVGVVLSFKQFWLFKVQIPSDANVALTTFKDKYDGDIYEISIGAENNTITYIK